MIFVVHLLFWLGLFASLRLLQAGVWAFQFGSVPPQEFLQLFWKAIPLDLSMAAYFLLPQWVIRWGSALIPHKVFKVTTSAVHFLLLAAILIFSLAETGLYTEWRCKINATALEHLRHPEEVFRTAGLAHYLLFLIPLLFIGIPAVWISKKFLHLRSQEVPFRLLFLQQAFALFMLITMVRGGWQPIPISQSSAIFSKTDWVNDAAVNTGWNLAQSIAEYGYSGGKDRLDFVEPSIAKQGIQSLFPAYRDTTNSWLKHSQPNVVILICEGLSADMISAIGKTPKGFTPNLDQWATEGIRFSDCYTSAYVSDQGIPAVLSGYPAMFGQSITHEPALSRGLTGIFPVLKKQQYQTAFFFGGDLGYGNLRAYLLQQHIDHLIEEKDLRKRYPSGRLGVHDQYVFGECIRWCNQAREPFALACFTLSTHLPYDYPNARESSRYTEESAYAGAVQYLDRCLGEFMLQAKQQAWFANTLFVLTSDHSHGTPFNRNNQTASFNRIPLFFWGPALENRYRAYEFMATASQLDLARTLLEGMHLDASAFQWSRNVFHQNYVPSAGIAYHGGSGMVYRGQFSFLSHEVPSRLRQDWNSGVLSATDSLNLMWCRMVLQGYKKK